MNKASVIADTCIWIEYFKGLPKIKNQLPVIITEESLCLCGIVVNELFQGIKSPQEREIVQSAFEAFPYLEMTRAIWEKAAGLSLSLRNKGITIPPSDLILASLAIENKCLIFTHDTHFNKIPGVNLYYPEYN